MERTRAWTIYHLNGQYVANMLTPWQNPLMEEIDPISKYLADNIQSLRKKKGFSQDQLAARAQIPRSTLTHMESGMGNPSLKNLAKISGALGIGIEELLSRPRSGVSFLSASEIPVEQRNRGTAVVYKLLPDKVKGLEIDRIELQPGTTMLGRPHLAGTKEYLMTMVGEITIQVAGEVFRVAKGDVLAFPGDQRHSYRSSGPRGRAVAISVVIPVPVQV